jgi:Rnl2 family RNA ligase
MSLLFLFKPPEPYRNSQPQSCDALSFFVFGVHTDAMFLPYDKIEERWQRDTTVDKAFANERWVVTEKIHGANFVVLAEPKRRLQFAKRRDILVPGESFFGHELVVARIAQQLERTVELARERVREDAIVAIYGELFGGHYPHPRVEALPGQKPVQTGVWYSPRVEYCAFDLAILRDDTREYLAYDVALEIFSEAGLFAAEPIYIGRLAQAMQVPIERPSTIAARLGLPPLAEPNLSEGVVIKSLRPLRIDDEFVRPSLKQKIPAFAEDERYSGAEKPVGTPAQSADALGQLLDRGFSLLAPPRAAATISKIGRLDNDARRQQALTLLVDEVLEELATLEPAATAALAPHDRTILRDQLTLQAATLL